MEFGVNFDQTAVNLWQELTWNFCENPCRYFYRDNILNNSFFVVFDWNDRFLTSIGILILLRESSSLSILFWILQYREHTRKSCFVSWKYIKNSGDDGTCFMYEILWRTGLMWNGGKLVSIKYDKSLRSWECTKTLCACEKGKKEEIVGRVE